MTLPRPLANAVYFRIWVCLFFRILVSLNFDKSVRIYQLNG